MTTNTIGQDLADLRERNGLSIRELARRTGMNPSQISEIERGKRDPQATTIAALAGALGARVSFTDDGAPALEPAE